MGKTTVAEIIHEACTVLWDTLQPFYLQTPNKEMWQTVAEKYYEKWNFPNCIGSIDGKHIRIKCPPNSGSTYHNYKQFFSILLQAVVDADKKFIAVDIGTAGRQSDGGNFRTSSLYNFLENGQLDIPESKPLPFTNTPVPFVLLGDEGYPLLQYLMRPYPARNLDDQKRIFNYRLSRARNSVECAFGIMTAKWRLLHKSIEANVENAVQMVKAICVLHNFVLTLENTDSNMAFQEKILSTNEAHHHAIHHRFSSDALRTRNTFCDYFNGVGSVAWQEDYALPQNIIRRNSAN